MNGETLESKPVDQSVPPLIRLNSANYMLLFCGGFWLSGICISLDELELFNIGVHWYTISIILGYYSFVAVMARHSYYCLKIHAAEEANDPLLNSVRNGENASYFHTLQYKKIRFAMITILFCGLGLFLFKIDKYTPIMHKHFVSMFIMFMILPYVFTNNVSIEHWRVGLDEKKGFYSLFIFFFGLGFGILSYYLFSEKVSVYISDEAVRLHIALHWTFFCTYIPILCWWIYSRRVEHTETV